MKRNRYIRLAEWLMALLFSPLLLVAQESGEVRVIPSLERSTISIGEQVKLNVRVVYPRTSVSRLVLPEDTLVNGVEIMGSELVDSLVLNDLLAEMVYDVVITSFDSATYRLKNIAALVGDSLYQSREELSLVVNTVSVDLDHPEHFADIKAQWKPHFVWTDYLLYLYILLGVLLLASAVVFLIHYLKKHKQRKVEGVPIGEPLLDPYEEAKQSIEALKGEGLLERNKTKEYYTELTDILRRYLFRLYGMSTMDMTSSEILEAFRNEVGRDRMFEELKKILQTADLAKFAKYQPEVNESMGLLSAAVAFIEEHKPEVEPHGDTTDGQKGGTQL